MSLSSDKALKLYDRFDKFINQWLAENHTAGTTIYCQEGCHGCCRLAVHASYPEAVAVAGKLTGRQATSLAGYIERLRESLPQLTDLKSYLKSHRQQLGPCPFLDGRGSCSIYPMRPLSCRALLSTKPAAWCEVDFSELDKWDKQAYASSLDRRVVAWPTHYVGASQDQGRQLEDHLLETMRQEQGWSLSGNFAVMTWLERNHRLSKYDRAGLPQFRQALAASQLDHPLLLDINISSGDSSHSL